MAEQPILAITPGDAAGVGPEVLARAMLNQEVRARCRPLVLGNPWVIERACALLGGKLSLHVIAEPNAARYAPDALDVLDTHNLSPADVQVGQIALVTGRESGETLVLASRLVQAGTAQGLVSGPVNKAALGLAGFGHGHLELVAAAIGWQGPIASMLGGPRLKVVNMTDHCSLVEAGRRVTKERITTSLQMIDRSFRAWGYARPRIAVCALNPHNGERGVFGREEIEQIAPAVAVAQAAGVDARGPFPVDTLFARALAGEFDVVLAMYHDQGFTPVKTVALHETASIGLGLPIPYATTDHGTGLDIAGRGVAHPGSLEQALRVAAQLAGGRLGLAAVPGPSSTS